ncbi:proline-rich protein 2-like, partial [Aplysia californica]|uniref:Proline-rich protein 2-like n=1 Tax=Aplysia californica TaxID=6500 RepID=A0ABM1VW32_APLCA
MTSEVSCVSHDYIITADTLLKTLTPLGPSETMNSVIFLTALCVAVATSALVKRQAPQNPTPGNGPFPQFPQLPPNGTFPQFPQPPPNGTFPQFPQLPPNGTFPQFPAPPPNGTLPPFSFPPPPRGPFPQGPFGMPTPQQGPFGPYQQGPFGPSQQGPFGPSQQGPFGMPSPPQGGFQFPGIFQQN